MIKVTTIWWGNGQSNLLDWLFCYLWDKIEISSIVSMSDDGRTTWELMRAFETELDTHLPPPWDLRRCLFSLSNSKYRDYFKLIFEYTFLNESSIKNFTIFELFKQVNKELIFFWKADFLKDEIHKFVEIESWDLYNYISSISKDVFSFKLPLSSTLKWHKFWNLLMASLFYNLWKDYDKMLNFMHKLLEVNSEVIPVTTKKAYIKAILWNGEIIESQDRISNVANYNSGISDLELSDCSIDASHNKKVHEAIIKSDFIVIWPWDLFTSIISNFIISWVKDSIKQTKAKIIYIWNSTNKLWETNGLTQIDFVNKIERFLGRRIDIFLVNDKKLDLSSEQKQEFQNDISVKGWDYLFISNGEKLELERRKIKVIKADLLWESSFYKHSKKRLVIELEKIFFNK